jgi:hypothetical protein
VVSQQQPKSTISAGDNLREARARDDMNRSRSVLPPLAIPEYRQALMEATAETYSIP